MLSRTEIFSYFLLKPEPSHENAEGVVVVRGQKEGAEGVSGAHVLNL